MKSIPKKSNETTEEYDKAPKVEIKTKTGKEAFVIFYSYDGQKAYVKGEEKFCRQAYKDYCSAFTKSERKATKDALETQRRLFAETQGYAPGKRNPTMWIFHPKLPKEKA